MAMSGSGSLRFTADTVSDEKRLVRGEHWLMARTMLRARDHAHNKKWRVLTLAGGAPFGEISAIRELMPKAFILAVDRDRDCLSAAIDAGADDVLECDLGDFGVKPPTSICGSARRVPNKSLQAYGNFDVINLDFCAGVSEVTRDISSIYRSLLTARGVLMITFSYGRDVVEVFHQEIRRAETQAFRQRGLDRLREAGVPDTVIGRLLFLFSPSRLEYVCSVMLYRGAQMPMCAVLTQASSVQKVSFVRVEPGDFECAVVYPDMARLYDCPHDRLESLRRQCAAIKASFTRQQKLVLAPEKEQAS